MRPIRMPVARLAALERPRRAAPTGGPACWAPGSHGPRVSSLGTSGRPAGGRRHRPSRRRNSDFAAFARVATPNSRQTEAPPRCTSADGHPLIAAVCAGATSTRAMSQIASSAHAGRHVPGARRGAGRGAARARAARARRRRRAGRGDRRLRLGPAHLPRARADRARLHARPRVRRHGGRGGRRRDRGGRGRPRAGLLLLGLRQLLLLPPRRLPQVRRGARVRARQDARLAPGRPGRAGARAARQPDPAAACQRACPTTPRCSPAT